MKWVVLILSIIVLGCTKETTTISYKTKFEFTKGDTISVVEIKSINDSSHILGLDVYINQEYSHRDFRDLPHPIFRIETGDVDNNGTYDILIGLIKVTRFDPVKRKRLFIYHIENNMLRSLWMGSRLSQPLYDFTYNIKNKSVISIEEEVDGSYLLAEYQWDSFGLKFNRFIQRNCNLVLAKILLKTCKL